MAWNWAGCAANAVIAAWCILGFMMTSFYTSKLTSLLVETPPALPFTTVTEMLARDDYTWGMVTGTKLFQILKESNNSLEKELYARMMTFAEHDPEVFSHDYQVHITKVLSEKYAFIGDSTIVDTWPSEHCEITVLPVKLTGLEYYSILLPKDSVITAKINDVLLRLHTSGSMVHLRDPWFPSSTRCQGNQSPRLTFSLATMQGPFYVAAAGLFLAAVLLCVERCGLKAE